MEKFSKIQKDESTKKEFEGEKEKCRLNLRKNKIDEILSSKRRKIFLNESNNEIKKYSIKLEEIINNIPDEYKIDMTQFHDNVRKFILYLYIV